MKVSIMDEDDIPDVIRKALIDKYEGWELVELLDIDIEDVIDAFEIEIVDNLEDLKEELRINNDNQEQD